MNKHLIPTNDNGDPPIQDNHTAQIMNAVADGLNDVFNQGKKGEEATYGWCLFVFPYGTARMNYISNCDRKDMVKAMMNFLERNKNIVAEIEEEDRDGI